MTTKPHNPPAFPFTDETQIGGEHNDIVNYRGYPGMTLRDWFAGKVNVGSMNDELIIALTGNPIRDKDPIAKLKQQAEAHAKARYILADAMLAEREAS